jgi:aminoglycoside 3-N-acetyltransferase
MTVRLQDLLLGLRELRLGTAPVVVHASLSAFGEVEGGPASMVQALTTVFGCLLAPTFTYKAMIIPLTGPADNGLIYGSGADQNRMAEFFTPNLPADPLMGIIPETLRRDRRARRSSHPLLSFAGVQADPFLESQTVSEPFEPLRQLMLANGWALLLGVDHTVNTSIHAAERLAGRRTFTRWALTPQGVVECPNFPGCSAGFGVLGAEMEKYCRGTEIGHAQVQAVPLRMLFRVVMTRIQADPLALLCHQEDCDRCSQTRVSLQRQTQV